MTWDFVRKRETPSSHCQTGLLTPKQRDSLSLDPIVRIRVLGVGGLSTATNVNSLASGPDVLGSLAKHMIKAVKIALLLRLRLSLVHGLGNGKGVLLAASKAVEVVPQVANLITRLGQQTVQRVFVLAVKDCAGLIAVVCNVLRQFITVLKNGPINGAHFLRKVHGVVIDNVFNAINTASQGRGNAVKLCHDSGGLVSLRGLHLCGRDRDGFIHLSDALHKTHVRLVLLGAPVFPTVAAEAIIPATVPVMPEGCKCYCVRSC